MYEQAEPVWSSLSRPDSGQTSGPPPQIPPAHQGGSHGRVRHGNGDSDKLQEDQEASSHTYEEAEVVKGYATCTSAASCPNGYTTLNGICYKAFNTLKTFSDAAVACVRSCTSKQSRFGPLSRALTAAKPTGHRPNPPGLLSIKVVPAGVSAMATALLTSRKKTKKRLHTHRTYPGGARCRALCRFIRSHRSCITAGIALLIAEISQLSTTVDALKRAQDDMRELSTTVDALKRDRDDTRQLSTTIDALKRDQDDMPTNVDTLKRAQDDMCQLSTTVEALKRDQDDMRQLSTTFDKLKRDQHDMPTTVDALKRDLDSERSRVTVLEQRLQEMPSCPTGYTVFRGICYKAFDTPKSFSDAAAACGEDGGTLAMPRDAETNAFLISLKSVSDVAFWFGLHDRWEEGSFEWVDGSALGTYSSWGPGQPSSYGGNADCVMYSTYWKDKWVNFSCDSQFPFICQAVPGRP
ncbi:uncharacterized protein LOC144859876 [Branchiostoma floridae x Branchiostoma japonicum]